MRNKKGGFVLFLVSCYLVAVLNDIEGRILRNLVTATRCVLEGVKVAGILIVEGALLLQVLDDLQREELPLEAT